MNTPDEPFEHAVFEDNLRRLLRRSYVPVLPAPAFRRTLEAAFRSEFERRFVPARPRLRPRLVAALAVAAALLLMFLRFAGGPSPVEETPERLLARGDVALRLERGPWRAGTADERFAGGRLEVQTPAARVQTLRLEEGRLTLAVAGRLELASDGAGLSGRLEEGRVELERVQGSEPAWRFVAGSGELRLFTGTARVALDGEAARFLLATGRAELVSPAGTRRLAPGEETVLAPHLAAVSSPLPDDAEREDIVPVPAAAVPAEEPASTDPAPAQGLRGRLVVPVGARLPSRVEVALLPIVGGNRVMAPQRRTLDVEQDTFLWPAPPTGRQRVYVRADGWALATVTELVLEGESHDLGDVTLVPGGRVTGEVIDAETGAPLPEVLVVSETDLPAEGLPLHEADTYLWLPASTRTGSDGRFAIEHLSPGRHRLLFSRPGHAPKWIEVLVADGAERSLVPTALDLGGAVQGTVTREDGSPWAGAQVLAARMDTSGRNRLNFVMAQTDSFGAYRLEALPSELMMIVMIGDPERPQVRPVEVRARGVARVDFDASRRGVRVSGRLLDAAGKPITHQNMGLFLESDLARGGEDWEATTTDGEGRFVFDALEPGLYAVMLVDRMGSRLAFVSALDVPTVAEHTLDLRLGAGRLTGRVRSGLDGTAARAVVHLESRRNGEPLFGGYTETDAGGRYTFENLSSGTYVVTAYPLVDGLGHGRSEPARLDARDAASPGVLEVDFELFEGGRIETTLVDAEGFPISYATISVITEGGVDLSFSENPVTDGNGLFLALGVRPGKYTLVARRGEATVSSGTVECLPGSTTRVRLVWPDPLPPSETDR